MVHQINVFSIPPLLVLVVALVTLWQSNALDWNRSSNLLVLRAYRLFSMVNVALMALYAVAFANDAWFVQVCRLILGAFMFLAPTFTAFAWAGFGRLEPKKETPLWALCITSAVLLAFEPGWFVTGLRHSEFGFSVLVPGPGYLVYVVLITSIFLWISWDAYRARFRMRALYNHTGWWLSGLCVLCNFNEFFLIQFQVNTVPTIWLCSLMIQLWFSHELMQVARSTSSSLQHAEAQLTRDELTGLHNRRYGLEALEGSLEAEVCVVFVDVDDFKRFNDTHGHVMGDRALQTVAKVLLASTRGSDVVVRYAGDEFFVVLPKQSFEVGCVVAERIRAGLEHAHQHGLPAVTVSVGVTVGMPGELALEVLDRADQCTYRAKNAGKNQVVSANP